MIAGERPGSAFPDSGVFTAAVVTAELDESRKPTSWLARFRSVSWMEERRPTSASLSELRRRRNTGPLTEAAGCIGGEAPVQEQRARACAMRDKRASAREEPLPLSRSTRHVSD